MGDLADALSDLDPVRPLERHPALPPDRTPYRAYRSNSTRERGVLDDLAALTASRTAWGAASNLFNPINEGDHS